VDAGHASRSHIVPPQVLPFTLHGVVGYIGSHMVSALLDAGERVVVLDNLSTGFNWAVPPDGSFAIGDAGDQSQVAALIAEHRVDVVLHFAAWIVVPDSVRDPLGYTATIR
jgi:UDP-glucose 4-epimerase